MRRTTVLLPDDLAALLELERRQRDVSAAEIIREALSAYLRRGGTEPARLRFIGMGRGGGADAARRVDAILAQEWTRDRLVGDGDR
jgi:hypothetical protein